MAITAGAMYGYRYELTPSETGAAATHWPAESALSLSQDQPTLLMFIHPRCPCSRSSLSELAILMTRCQNRLSCEVVFLSPSEFSEQWAKSDLWGQASEIPGATPRLDVDGVEHQRFGAEVSGEVLLFSHDGRRLFQGGITAGRGHAGDNLGRSAIEAFLLHQHLPTDMTPVYGCQLRAPAGLADSANGTHVKSGS